MRVVVIIFLMIVSCTENEAVSSEQHNNSKNSSRSTDKPNYLFYINEEDNLSLEMISNKISIPCGSLKNFPSIKQLPENKMSYFNVKSIGIGFDCEKDLQVYPLAPGIVIDVQEGDSEIKMFDFYQRLVDTLGYMPQDIRRVLYNKYIVIDHGKYFNEKYRVLAIYSNLTDLDPSIVVGSQVSDSNYPLGKINTANVDFLTSFTQRAEADTNKFIVKENTINIDILFEKDETTYFYPGKGINIERDSFKEFFKDR